MADPSALHLPIGSPMWLIARNDARLARRAAQGDSRAFAVIYERYHQELYRYCRALLRDSHEAQDALQSTMASALRSLPGEDRAIELRPWLYRVAHNEAVSIMRRRRPLGEPEDGAPPHEPGADVAFESRERLRSLVSDLARLPERQRSALVMRELSGLSPEQIATALNVTAGAARQLVYEARVALQEFAEGRSMECERVREAISDGDGRVLRGRRLRAHLRGCESCTDFRAGIEARSRDLELIAPPLSAVAASGVLASLLGGGSTGAGALGGLLGTGAGGMLGGKSLGVIAASAAIGIGAGAGGEVGLPGFGGQPDSPPASAPSAPGAPPAARAKAGAGAHANAVSRGRKEARRPDAGRHGGGSSNAQAHGRGAGKGSENSAAGSAAGGASAAAPAGAGRPAKPPGSDVANPRSGGHAATPPAAGRPEHASSEPPDSANAGGLRLGKGRDLRDSP